MDNNSYKGHFTAFLTLFIWGTTFISTKILLADFQPTEILLIRFVLGFLVLLIVYPKRIRGLSRRQELTFFLAGLCGVCLYYLLENIALTLTLASDVGVIISIAPFFTGILTYFFSKDAARPGIHFFVGFIAALSGICLISFSSQGPAFNLAGDSLAILAALVWAVYSILSKKISSFQLHTVQATRHTFFYGICCMVPALFLFGFRFQLSPQILLKPENIFNLLFLGFGASALCFVTWNISVRLLGAVRTSIYIYMVPVVTVIFSRIVLHESLTPISVVGILLTLSGLIFSEFRPSSSKAEKKAAQERSPFFVRHD